VIADLLEREGRTLADELGDHAIFSRLDVTSDEDWAATVAAAEAAFGPVSVLVNNAGIVRFGQIEEAAPAVWRQVLEINVTGAYLGIRAVVASMRKAGGGAIVNISSGAGFTATFTGRGFGLAVTLDLHAPNLSRVDAEDLMRRAHALCPYSNATRGNIDLVLCVDGTTLERPAA